jgi:hypothetical protein
VGKWQFRGSALFDLLEMLALSEELPAHLVEARRQCTTVLLREFAVDDDASGSESRPQGQPRDSNERRLKAVCQIERRCSQSRSTSRWTIIVAKDIT